MGNKMSIDNFDIMQPKLLKTQIENLTSNNIYSIDDKFLLKLEEKIKLEIEKLKIIEYDYFHKWIFNLKNNSILSHIFLPITGTLGYLFGSVSSSLISKEKMNDKIKKTKEEIESLSVGINPYIKNAIDAVCDIRKPGKNYYVMDKLRHNHNLIKQKIESLEQIKNNCSYECTKYQQEFISFVKDNLFTGLFVFLSGSLFCSFINTNNNYETNLKNLEESLQIIRNLKQN